MEIKAERQTATIYQFPAGGRRRVTSGLGARLPSDLPARRLAASAPAEAAVDCGSGWYHGAAISDVSREG